MQQHHNLNEFLKIASGQREVALIISRDDSELQEQQQVLKKNGFVKVDRTAELLKQIQQPTKLYFTVSGTINKNIYDFIAQFPTGQVEIFDNSQMKTSVFTPDYVNLSVAAVVTKKDLLALEAVGFSLRQHCGVAYQV